MSSENSRIPSADAAASRIVLRPSVHKALWGEEAWEISAYASDPGMIVDGPFAGHSLRDVFPNFPLLFKTIKANDALSVQVHPNEKTSLLSGGEPKTEMWCALADSTVYAGLKPGIDSKKALPDAIKAGSVPNWLVRHDLKAGDVVFIPGGMVHAIGAESLLYEVQQSSNTTFRFYDWGRVGTDGKPRELHVEQAMNAIDWTLPPPVVGDSAECPLFSFRQVHLDGELRVGGNGKFLAIRSADGGFSLAGEEFQEGSSVLLPPSVSGVLQASGAWLLLTEFAP